MGKKKKIEIFLEQLYIGIMRLIWHAYVILGLVLFLVGGFLLFQLDIVGIGVLLLGLIVGAYGEFNLYSN